MLRDLGAIVREVAPLSGDLSRLGWLTIPERLLPECAEVQAWAGGVDASRVVLIGMGGSSLGPEMLRAVHGSDRLVVLDTTDPATIASVEPEGALFVVSSKSGTTLEPRVLADHFWTLVPDPARWVAVTDPGTQLFVEAKDKGFARVFENDPNIGGRFSVLSWFGLVPAALMGIDIDELCRRPTDARDRLVEEGIELGASISAAQRAGRDKLTLQLPPGRTATFGLWAEQLVAESLGKDGTGVVPVPTTDAEAGDDREVVVPEVVDAYGLSEDLYRWEVATAVAGRQLGVDAFDQPDVEAAKVATRAALDDLPLPDGVPAGVDVLGGGGLLAWLEGRVRPRDYVALMAYLPYGQDDALEQVRRTVRDHLGGMAVTAGYGPRFLHSTGQLHKGGPDSIVAVQVVPRRPTAALGVPGLGYDFGTLIAAQALGDLRALVDRGRRVVRVEVDRDVREVLG